MAVRQYIGARYVPKFYENSNGTNEWSSGTAYEALTIVSYNNNSFTSKKPVPAGIGNPAANPEYWASTGIYNAQIDEYRQETQTVKEQSSKNALKNCRFVFVGDSYAAGYAPSTGDVPANGWSQVIKSTLGLSSDACYAIYQGGAGFSSERPGGGYAAMLSNAAGTISDKSEIDYVICCGGHNDISSTASNIRTGIGTFYSTARGLFPNAKIMFGMIAWDRNGSTQNSINSLLVNYLEYQKDVAPDMAYLNGVENILYKVSTYLDTDGIHPTPAGNKALAEGIMQAIQTGYCTVDGSTTITPTPETGVSIGAGISGGYSCDFYNGTIRLRSLRTEYNFSEWKQINGNRGYIDLVTLSGIPRGTNATGYTQNIYLPCLVRMSDSSTGGNAAFRYLTLGIGITGNKLRITFYVMNDAGSNWKTFYSNQITMPEFEIYIDMHSPNT